MNTFGTIFRLTTFGESHGSAIGGVVDGMPAGITIDEDFIRSEMARRRPGQSALVTPRKEADEVELLSGIFEGHSTGAPIGFVIRNTDTRSGDYSEAQRWYRPSHADYTYDQKYGFRDYRGGGRASARETAVRVVGGALAKMVLRERGISVEARLLQVGCETTPEGMEALIQQVKSEGDSIGGIVGCTITGCPTGLGEPVYGKLHAALGAAMLSINACHGFDYGAGFNGVGMRGSEQNDTFVRRADGTIGTASNYSGGIQGGISNGEPITFRVLFKPTPTVLRAQQTVDSERNEGVLTMKGRHDPCVAVRAVPIVEAMAAMTVLDYYLMCRATSGF